MGYSAFRPIERASRKSLEMLARIGYCIYLFDNDAKEYQVELEAEGRGIYLYCLFVCCSLLFFVSPHFCRAFFVH